MLIRAVSQPDAFAWQEWRELKRRTLSPHEMNRLAEGLLDARLKAEYLVSDSEEWLSDSVSKGVLPQSIVNRFYNEMIEVNLQVVCPDDGEHGIRIKPRAIAHSSDFLRTNNPYILIEGFYLDNDSAPLKSNDRAIHLGEFCPASPEHLLKGQTVVCPELIVEKSADAATTIRFACWLAVAPNWLVQPVQWGDDGKPILTQKVNELHRIIVDISAGPKGWCGK